MIAAVAAIATPAAQPSTSLDTVRPGSRPAYRDGVGGRVYSSHPAETRFSSTHFTRLHQMPLIGADPKEERIRCRLWRRGIVDLSAGRQGNDPQDRDGLTFNDGTPSRRRTWSFARPIRQQIRRSPDLRHAQRDRHFGQGDRQQDGSDRFRKGSPTFDVEISTMVFPLYVTSKAYTRRRDFTAAFDRFRAKPLRRSYRVVARQAKESMTLMADRRIATRLPVYDRIEIARCWRPAPG